MKATFLFLICSLVLSSSCLALLVEGPKESNSVSVQNLAGSSQSWRNIGSGIDSDDSYAISADSLTKSGYSDYLVFTDFGFSLPNNALIYGIQVIIECRRTGGDIVVQMSRLVYNGSIGATNVLGSSSFPFPSDKSISHGNVFETWGESWSDSEINSSSFGYAMTIQMPTSLGATDSALIDNISILVYYDVPLAIDPSFDLIAAWESGKPIISGDIQAQEGQLTVQRSTDGRFFEPIHSRPIQDTKSFYFQWADDQFQDPETPLYYRLEISRRGALEVQYSPTIYLAGSGGATPAPFANLQVLQEQLALRLGNREQHQISLIVFSGTGQSLYQKKWQPDISQSQQDLLIPSIGWASGWYVLLIQQGGTVQKIPFSIP